MARSRRRPSGAELTALRAGICCALLAALAGCAASSGLRGPAPEPETDAWKSASTIRVGLAVGAPNVVVAGSTEWSLIARPDRTIGTYKPGPGLKIARTSGRVEAFLEGDPTPLWSGSSEETLVVAPSARGYARWDTKWYRGTFRVFASQGEGLTLVNDVDFESYLRSVLPHEIGTPPESDFEAVKAQAVAARSYTLSYLGRRAALGFDLYASVEDQVYGGVGRENTQSDRALEETQGEVLWSEGAPIRALYSSACGGRTANVEDVWPWPWTAYLRSVRDAEGRDATPYCSISSNFRWREEWDVPSFLATVREYGPAEGGATEALAGSLLDVRVMSRSRSGRVNELEITTSEGDWVVRGDRIRWVLRRPGQSAILRSSFLKIAVLRDDDGKPVRVIATGAGNGHGIGLCQWGAMGMARAGKGYKEILRHYYKSTTVARSS